jgi:hypothetical protein
MKRFMFLENMLPGKCIDTANNLDNVLKYLKGDTRMGQIN